MRHLIPFLLLGTIVPSARADGQVSVPASVFRAIRQVLTEQPNGGAPFLSPVYPTNLTVVESCTIDVVFLYENAGYRNSVGYFTYRVELDGSISILDRQLVFADASLAPSGPLTSGTSITLKDAQGQDRVFQPGERIGFFLVANGFHEEMQIRHWNPLTATIPSIDPAENEGFGRGAFTTIDHLNPEVAHGQLERARHAALITMPGEPGFLGGNDFTLIGFEDLPRSRNSDEDFNDFMAAIRASSPTAFETASFYRFIPADPDQDGVGGARDAYPLDPTRATVERVPAVGHSTIVVEDLYPGLGDGDYNDLVVGYHYVLVKDAAGDVREILGTFYLLARGARLDHRMGVRLPGLQRSTRGRFQVERFLSTSAGLVHELEGRLPLATLRDGRIDDLFYSTISALPPLPGSPYATNTDVSSVQRLAAGARFLVEFDEAFDVSRLGKPPYDFFVLAIQTNGEEYDIHLPGFEGFPRRPQHLPQERGSGSFIDGAGYPFLMDLPTVWRFPLERIPVEQAYPMFETFRSSRGAQKRNWYDFPTSTPGLVSDPIGNYLPNFPWTLDVPLP